MASALSALGKNKNENMHSRASWPITAREQGDQEGSLTCR